MPDSVATSRVFSDEFMRLEPGRVACALESDGIFAMPGAVDESFVERILRDVAGNGFAINRNWASAVLTDTQYYLTHMLATSAAFCDFATHEKILTIADHVLGPRYRLKAHRYYETRGRHHMQWHTDNKTDRAFAHIPGLIVIVYLSDVDDGEFQFVRGSHKWSGDSGYSDYEDDAIAERHREHIVGFKGSRGTLLIYNTYGVHRAKPSRDPDFVRKTLFMQVDANMTSAEPLLLCPGNLQRRDDKVLDFLGFGLPADYVVFPQTTSADVPLTGEAGRALAGWLLGRARRTVFRSLPEALRSRILRLRDARRRQ